MKKETKNLIGIIGDIHMKEFLGYADYIADKRIPEKKKILDFIVEQLSDCNRIIFMGDIFHSRTPVPIVVKEFVNFLERFEGKEVFILGGNHDSNSQGKSSLDFLKEVKNKNWSIITNEIITVSSSNSSLKLVFCPYFTNSQLETTDNTKATEKVMKLLNPGDVLFAHHAISDTLTASGINTDIFPELVLPKEKLEKKYKMIIGGHIHHPQVGKQTILTGSVFCNEVGEKEKFIWKMDEDTLKVEQIKLPCREIHKITDPTDKDLSKITKDSIVKVIITKKMSADVIRELKEKLRSFSAFILIENIPHERTKMHFTEGESILEFDISQLLEVYAKERKVDIAKLKHGFELIK